MGGFVHEGVKSVFPLNVLGLFSIGAHQFRTNFSFTYVFSYGDMWKSIFKNPLIFNALRTFMKIHQNMKSGSFISIPSFMNVFSSFYGL